MATDPADLRRELLSASSTAQRRQVLVQWAAALGRAGLGDGRAVEPYARWCLESQHWRDDDVPDTLIDPIGLVGPATAAKILEWARLCEAGMWPGADITDAIESVSHDCAILQEPSPREDWTTRLALRLVESTRANWLRIQMASELVLTKNGTAVLEQPIREFLADEDGVAIVLLHQHPTARSRGGTHIVEDWGGVWAVLVTANQVLPMKLEIDVDDLYSRAEQWTGAANAPLHSAKEMRDVLGWLRRKLIEPLAPTVGEHRRIWWVPAGAFSVLPLHAASISARSESPDEPKLEMAAPTSPELTPVQSYAASLAVLASTADLVHSGRFEKGNDFVVVGVRKTHATIAGSAESVELAFAIPEAISVARRLGAEISPEDETDLQLSESVAIGPIGACDIDHEELEELIAPHDGSILHFCGHAKYAPSAEEYRLYLRDSTLTLSDMLGLPDKERKSRVGYLAVLSACETQRLSEHNEEALGFATAMQLTGYANCIASAHPVDDRSTSEWMNTFYEALVGTESRSGRAVATAAAEATVAALTRALENVGGDRQRVHPVLWTAWAHYGP